MMSQIILAILPLLRFILLFYKQKSILRDACDQDKKVFAIKRVTLGINIV